MALVRSFLPFLLRTPSLVPSSPSTTTSSSSRLSRTWSSTGGSQAGDRDRPFLAGAREEDRERGGDPPSTSGKTSEPKRVSARRRPSRGTPREGTLFSARSFRRRNSSWRGSARPPPPPSFLPSTRSPFRDLPGWDGPHTSSVCSVPGSARYFVTACLCGARAFSLCFSAP